jgi:hypothetical protein
MKRQLLRLFFVLLFVNGAVVFESCETTQPVLDDSQRVVSPPFWAPAYDNAAQVHYYYLPDLEIYYDVWTNEFVYLDGGHWIFSPFLPPMYTSYDLRSAPIVILDYRVHEPWSFHELYASHYPRYYFQTVPIGTNVTRPRGLDENVNKPVFYELNENSLQNKGPQKPLPITSTSPGMVTPNKMQPARYNGKSTGHPVKVDKKMMKPKNEKKANQKKDVTEPKKDVKPKQQVSNYKELPIEKK